MEKNFILYEVSRDDVQVSETEVHPKQVGFCSVVINDATLDYPVLYDEALNRFMAVVPVAEVEIFNEAYGPQQ